MKFGVPVVGRGDIMKKHVLEKSIFSYFI